MKRKAVTNTVVQRQKYLQQLEKSKLHKIPLSRLWHHRKPYGNTPGESVMTTATLPLFSIMWVKKIFIAERLWKVPENNIGKSTPITKGMETTSEKRASRFS